MRSVALVGVVGCILIACGAGSDSTTDTPSITTPGTSVGPEGGTVTENGVTITVPPGALAASTPIHITESTVVPNGYAVSGKVYRFEPSGTHFNAPITIALPSTKPEIVYWTVDGSEDTFEPVETEFDEAAANAKVQITHFSNGFVGTSPNGITCIVKQPSGCPGTKTTIESPSFWYVDKAFSSNLYGSKGALATNSIGVNRYMNTQSGIGVIVPNADRSVWKAATNSPSDPATAYVSQGTITNFTAKASRGGASAGSPCGFGPPGGVWAPTVEYTCSGGNVRIGDAPPTQPADAGVSSDSGFSGDASIDSSVSDSSIVDASIVGDSSAPEDASLVDASSGDSGAIEDTGSDAGATDDANVPDGGTIPSYVQASNFQFPIASTATATYSMSFTNNVVAGDLLVVGYFWNHAIGQSVVSVQDTLGSTYIKAFQVEDGVNNTVALWYTQVTQSGPNTIVVTVPTSTKNPFVASVLEYSGVTALDAQHTSYVTNVTGPDIATFDSGNIVTTYPREVLVGIALTNVPEIKTVTPFTERYVSASKYFAVEDFVNVGVGSYNAPFAINNPTAYMSKTKAAYAGIAAFH